MTNLVALLDVQVHDTALDQLRHQHATIPERAELVALQQRLAERETAVATARDARDAVHADEKRLDDEAATLTSKIDAANARLYSGEVTSPKELQALQADVESLGRHRSDIEDRELEVMEQREAADAAFAQAEQRRNEVLVAVGGVRVALQQREAEIEVLIAAEQRARDALAATIDAVLVTRYDACRKAAKGIGVARLAGNTCQGCHLTISATEAERIRHQANATLEFCENCGCILVVGA
jgi:predicted  nucleic acid-binding Zn-ribbon protein